MNKFIDDMKVLCPFYRGHYQNQIRCEGLSDSGNIFNSMFTNTEATKYRTDVCSDSWEHCGIAKMLNAKYEEKKC